MSFGFGERRGAVGQVEADHGAAPAEVILGAPGLHQVRLLERFGDGDEDLASWVRDRCPMSPQEIVDHNDQVVILGPTNERQWDYLKRTVTQLDPSTRDKITTWLDLMDLDDRVTFQRLRSGR